MEHYLAAQARGKGVADRDRAPGRVGIVELLPFADGLSDGMVIRRLDNRRLDEYVNAIRCMHGNRVLHKDDFARGLLTAMRGERRWGF